MADKTLRQLEEERRIQKEILDTILAQAKSDKERIAIKKGLADADQETVKRYKEAVSVLKELNEQAAELKSKNKERIDYLISEESRLKGLSGLQSLTIEHERKKIGMLAATPGLNDKIRASIQTISGLNQELLATSLEDVVTRAEIKKKIDEELVTLKGKRGVHGQLAKLMRQEYEIADGVSSMTEKQQQFLTKQLAVYDGIKDTIGVVLETASLLTSTVGGVLGSAIIGTGYAMEALGKTTRDFGGYLGGATVSATALGTIFPNAAEAAKSLSSEMGGLTDVTFQNQLNTNLMSENMGISVAEAAKLTSIFARVSDGSIQTAQNLAESTKEFAKQNGVAPSAVMADIANNAERFAEYGPDAALGLRMAGVQAAKLGVTMDTLGKVTDSLLDFETSITSELELSAMLGRNINLNRARGLAYEGKMGDAVKETINQLGGIASFNKMDLFQKREAAKMLGLSVDELSKMANNMDKINSMGEIQGDTFDSINQSLTAFSTSGLGGILQKLGGFALITPLLKDMGLNIGGMVKNSFILLKNLLGMVATPILTGLKTLGSTLLPSVGTGGIGSTVSAKLKSVKDRLFSGIGTTTSVPTVAPQPNVTTQAGGISKINAKSLLQGAAALVVAAGAMFVFAKSIQELEKIKDYTRVATGMGLMVIAIGLFAVAASAIGRFASGMVEGLLVIAAISGVIYILANAFNIFAQGMQILTDSFVTFTNIIPTFVTNIQPLISLAGGLFLLSAAFTSLGASLAVLGTMGAISLPVLTGLAAAGVGIGYLINAVSGDSNDGKETISNEKISDYEVQMLSKMDILIDAVIKTKDVYLDGEKVTKVIEKYVDRSTRNEYGIGRR